MPLSPESTRFISSRADLSAFAEWLLADLKAHPENWENRSLEAYLEALAHYLMEIDQYYANMRAGIDADTPGWRLFADALAGAAVYVGRE